MRNNILNIKKMALFAIDKVNIYWLFDILSFLQTS